MPENRFLDDVARTYDRTIAHMFAPEVLDPAVDCLASLADGGRVLEFAIGTGRVALPLTRRGLDVTGIELSVDMLAELRRAPGSERIHAIEGDMATTRVEGEFSLVYLVFNTITNLTTQDEQVACFENAARHLGIDDFTDRTHLQISRSRHFHRSADGTFREFTAPFRYVRPSELDLMARIAGLTLEHRWAGWDRAPFTGDSPSHVSVWS